MFPRTSALFTATDFGKLNGFECLPAFVRFDFLTELSVFTGGVSSTLLDGVTSSAVLSDSCSH
jgi:hypothetical protein